MPPSVRYREGRLRDAGCEARAPWRQIPLRAANRSARRRLVDDGPERAELADSIDEGAKIDRLHHIGIGAELVAADEILFLARGGEHYDGNGLQRFIRLQRTKHVETIELRHLQIEQKHRRVTRRPLGVTVAPE